MNDATRYALLRLWLSLGLIGCAVLFYLCLMPHPPTPNFSYADKVEHFIAYAGLGAWFASILAPRYLLVIVGLAGFGAAIEVVQAATDYRSGDVWDFVADLAGVFAGVGLARLGAMNWLRYIDARVAAARNHPG